jgi:hypothetical protein
VIELLVASNLLLWLAVIGLGAGYFALVRRRTDSNHQHNDEALHNAELAGTTPSLPAALADKLDEGSGIVLFASPGCPPCEQLHRDLDQGWAEPMPLIIVSDSPLVAPPGTTTLALGKHEARSLGERLGVRDQPYAWVLRSGVLAVGGVVNSADHLRGLLELSTAARAA